MKLGISVSILSLVILVASCKSGNNTDQKKKNSLNVAAPTITTTRGSAKIGGVQKIEIFPNSSIKVVSREISRKDTLSDDKFVLRCRTWDLSADAVEVIIMNGITISLHDFNYLYYVLPCEVKGAVEIDRVLYRYAVNAGSFFTISNEDTTYFYGCNASICRKYFLMHGGDPGRDLE